MVAPKMVKMFTLSTCSHCKAARQFLSDNRVPYEFNDVDLLAGAERTAVLEEMRRHNPRISFPTIIVGNQVIIGFQAGEIKKALGI